MTDIGSQPSGAEAARRFNPPVKAGCPTPINNVFREGSSSAKSLDRKMMGNIDVVCYFLGSIQTFQQEKYCLENSGFIQPIESHQ